MNWFMLASGCLNIGAVITALMHGHWDMAIVYGGWAVGNVVLSFKG
jgi:hypothetical protein